jgi:RNA polymerase sporulation-specific sigma factor
VSILEPVDLVETSDESLARFAQQGNQHATRLLLERYRNVVRAKARGYFLVGGDIEDVEQEGLIGLYKAIRDYRPDREASFRAFADLCIGRQIMTAIKTATRQKHRPLNAYVSISTPQRRPDGEDERFEEVVDDPGARDPADQVVAAQGLNDMQRTMAAMLSGLEVQVLHLYVEGRSYQEIGERLGRHAKSIDNALQRIKRKLDGHLHEREQAQLA